MHIFLLVAPRFISTPGSSCWVGRNEQKEYEHIILLICLVSIWFREIYVNALCCAVPVRLYKSFSKTDLR